MKYMRLIRNEKTIVVFEGTLVSLKKIAKSIKPKGHLLAGEITFDFGNDTDGFREYAVTKKQFENRIKVLK